VIFVTHDVGVAAEACDRLAVMYAGRFVEIGPTETVIEAPAHPYTAGLLASTVLGSARGQRLETIPGMPPDLGALPPGCSFAARCRFAEEPCREVPPSEFALSATHAVRCRRVAAGEIQATRPSLSDRAVR
jgi:peptide/nickel transport system ATP-binding protein